MDFKKLKNCFIVAEISANHGQNFNRAIALIKKAKECGADAVKFQAYTPDALTIDINNKYFKIRHPRWGRQTLYELYKKAYTPRAWFRNLKKAADDLGITFFATAFDKTAIDFLEELGVPFYKIASFELVDLPLIEYAAKTKKSMILSTGMATVSEIKEAISAARGAGARDIMLLKCTSSYPAKPEEISLKTIPHMERLFATPVGISDHTLGIAVSLAAVSLGAKMIEKHFTLSRMIKSADSFFSIEPDELKNLVEDIRIIERALGEVRYGVAREEKKSLIFRRSLFSIKEIKKGERFTESNVGSIRPANGLYPKYLKVILNKKAKGDIKKGMPLSWDLINNV